MYIQFSNSRNNFGESGIKTPCAQQHTLDTKVSCVTTTYDYEHELRARIEQNENPCMSDER